MIQQLGSNVKKFYKLLNLLYVLFHDSIVIFSERKFPKFIYLKFYFLLCIKFYEGIRFGDRVVFKV